MARLLAEVARVVQALPKRFPFKALAIAFAFALLALAFSFVFVLAFVSFGEKKRISTFG